SQLVPRAHSSSRRWIHQRSPQLRVVDTGMQKADAATITSAVTNALTSPWHICAMISLLVPAGGAERVERRARPFLVDHAISARVLEHAASALASSGPWKLSPLPKIVCRVNMGEPCRNTSRLRWGRLSLQFCYRCWDLRV